MLDIFAEFGNGTAILVMLGVVVVLTVPAIRIARSTDRSATWTSAILLGLLLTTIGLLAIGDIPSRILYWFDANHEAIAGRIPIEPLAELMASKNYFLIRDIVANTIQVAFFVILVAAVYFWGERHKREGRFGS